MNGILCLNPVKIINPSAKTLLLRHRHLLIDGKLEYVDNHQCVGILDSINCNTSLSKIFHTLPDDSCILDSDTGEVYPYYLSVPCRHCEACRYHKASSYIQRCQFECQQHSEPPLFVSLTYNDSHLPDGAVLCPRDIQLFKKRFNKFFERFGVRLKYMIFGEYGAKGRPHYHAIIFGVPLSRLNILGDQNTILYEITRIVQYCWRSTKRGYGSKSYRDYCRLGHRVFRRVVETDADSIGFVNVAVCSSKVPIQYVTKYVTKQITQDDSRPRFVSCSINLGVDYAKSLKPVIASSPDGRFFDGVKSRIALCTYYLNKLFPSYVRVIKSDIRKSLINFITAYRSLRHNRVRFDDMRDMWYKVCERFGSHFWRLNYSALDNNILTNKRDAGVNGCREQFSWLRQVQLDFCRLYDELISVRLPDLDYVFRDSDFRPVLLARMFSYSPSVDVSNFVYQKRTQYSRMTLTLN